MADDAETLLGYVGARVRRLRERKGLRQEDLAVLCGWDYRHIQRIEAGRVDIAITALVRVAGALKVAPPSLLRPTKPVVRKAGRPPKKKGSSAKK
jgi:transcriptional regulator with XRE-family HTH domain